MLKEESHAMAKFSGQMHLCDFCKDISLCEDPDAPNCRGPGGTPYSFPRLYSYEDWALRKFVRDSLKGVFPDKADDIDTIADPGEWGLENYTCRMVSIFIFMMAVVDHLKETMAMIFLLGHVPTEAGLWIQYEIPTWADKAYSNKVHGWSELDLVHFKVARMPLCWKIFTAFVVLLPKVFVWYTLVCSGVHFLMETSGIIDLIVNSVALKFVLDLDAIVYEHLTTEATRHIMNRVEPLPLFDEAEDEILTSEEVQIEYYKQESTLGHTLGLMVPKRLVMIAIAMCIFMGKYYWQNCITLEDGSIVSTPMYPLTPYTKNSVVGLLLNLKETGSDTPFWTMPEVED